MLFGDFLLLWDNLGYLRIPTLEYFGIALGLLWDCFGNALEYLHTLGYFGNAAQLLIFQKFFPLHVLDFPENFPPARLFHPARLLVLVFVVIINFLIVKIQVQGRH